MKALPARFQKQEHQFEDVIYTIQPLTNQLRSHIQGRNIEAAGKTEAGTTLYEINKGGWAFDVVAFSLVDIKGLEGLEIEYEEVTIGANVYTRVKDYCLDLFPRPLYDDIYIKATTAVVLVETETDEVGFTPGLSTEISPVPETSDSAAVEWESKSDTPLPITDVSDPPSYADASGSA